MAVGPVVSGVLSPQFHVYDAMVPSASVEVEPLTDTLRSASVWVNAAVGGWFGGGVVTVTWLVVVPVAPSLSVTVSLTGYCPADP